MAKFLALILMVLFTSLTAFAEEVTTATPTQIIEIEKSGAIAILQKQPTNENQQQVIRVKKAGGFLLIQINGKVKDTDITVQPK